MTSIGTLDEHLLKRNKHRLHLYFAEEDGWVGEQKERVLRILDGDGAAVKVVHGHPDIPHSFCISQCLALILETDVTEAFSHPDHGEALAQQCFDWLSEGGFIST